MHCSTPYISEKAKANPMAAILTAKLILDYLEEKRLPLFYIEQDGRIYLKGADDIVRILKSFS